MPEVSACSSASKTPFLVGPGGVDRASLLALEGGMDEVCVRLPFHHEGPAGPFDAVGGGENWWS